MKDDVMAVIADKKWYVVVRDSVPVPGDHVQEPGGRAWHRVARRDFDSYGGITLILEPIQ